MSKVIVHNPRPRARARKPKRRAKATPARRRNPSVSAIRRPRRRNPNPLTQVRGAALAAVPIITGMVATRAVTSMALKENDTAGVKGYGANLAVALILGMGANMLGAKKLGAGMIVGGVAATMLRAIGDQWPKTTSYLTDYVPTGMNQGQPWVNRPAFGDYVPQPLGPQQVFQAPLAQAAGPVPPMAQAQAA